MGKREDNEKKWITKISSHLVGKKIKAVSLMTQAEMDGCGWYGRSVMLELDDGSTIWASQDDEGNWPGEDIGSHLS